MDKEGLLARRLAGLSFAQIAKEVGISRQRVQQLLSPSVGIRRIVIARADGLCQMCGILVGTSGHVHHCSTDLDGPEDYNDLPNLQLLCPSCHRFAHLPEGQRTKGFVRIQFALPVPEYEAAAAAAMRSGETLTTLIRRLLREAAASNPR